MIDLESLQVGQCYLSRSGDVWRVTAINADRVLFEKRGQIRSSYTWRPGIINCKTFAAKAERLIPCDWTPESDET